MKNVNLLNSKIGEKESNSLLNQVVVATPNLEEGIHHVIFAGLRSDEKAVYLDFTTGIDEYTRSCRLTQLFESTMLALVRDFDIQGQALSVLQNEKFVGTRFYVQAVVKNDKTWYNPSIKTLDEVLPEQEADVPRDGEDW